MSRAGELSATSDHYAAGVLDKQRVTCAHAARLVDILGVAGDSASTQVMPTAVDHSSAQTNMTELLALMGGLLVVGVFFEDYSRARAHRAADRARSQADRLVARLRYQLADRSHVTDEELAKPFQLPGSVRLTPYLSYGLVATNTGLFLLVVVPQIGQPILLNPDLWDPAVIGAMIFWLSHASLGVLVRKGQRELVQELASTRTAFGDELVSEVRTSVLGPPTGWDDHGRRPLESLISLTESAADLVGTAPASMERLASEVLPMLVKDDWLSDAALGEAHAVMAQCTLASALRDVYHLSWRPVWDRHAQPFLEFCLADAMRESHAPGHRTAKYLAEGRLAEVLASTARWVRPSPEPETLERIREAASRRLAKAGETVAPYSSAPPAWVFPQHRDTWERAARESARDCSGLAHLLALIPETPASTHHGQWLECGAAISVVCRDAGPLVDVLARLFSREANLRDDRRMRELIDACKSVIDPHPWVDPCMRICVARAKAGSEVVDVDAALSALAVAAREWRPFPWSVAEALSHLQRDWPEEQLHDFVVSACQTTERGATADILATWLTEVLEAYRDAVTALTFDKRFPTQDHPPSFWEGDFPLWRLLNHTVVVSTTLVMAWLGTANIEPPPQLRANCMWRLVETAEATLMSASMTSELRRSAERWFP